MRYITNPVGIQTMANYQLITQFRQCVDLINNLKLNNVISYFLVNFVSITEVQRFSQMNLDLIRKWVCNHLNTRSILRSALMTALLID